MFYYLNGKLEYREANLCVIDCGGVGYKLTVSLNTSDSLVNKLNQKVKLYTYLAVREDGIELFGFGSNEERACFNQLITVSGVGPKAAISILSTLSPDKFSLAVCSEDVKAISKASGIGAKTAARIILELKDKISKDMMSASSKIDTDFAQNVKNNSAVSEATEALMVLGYDKNTVLGTLKGVNLENATDAGEIIKAVLKRLAR
ncbi:MAG: Holliday junction branch migration protein RuvA [Ruminococcaceae bacterium]|nr:Holliday junction branch migration protein RuvA [Oscillospiraceae bacterium]